MAAPPPARLPVVLLGATGSVGQRFALALAGHPWFELRALAASPEKAGRAYGEAVRWVQAAPLPEALARMCLAAPEPRPDARIVFSALGAAEAGPLEVACAEAGSLVVSNASAHRMDADVPLVVPEVNPEHLELARAQPFGAGAIVTNPNCSAIGLVLALAPLHARFGVERVHVVTMQALSGAGLPGVPAIETLDNLLPYIAGEEAKLAAEPRKILGRLAGGVIEPAPLVVSAQCNRVAVLDGHTECVALSLGTPAGRDDILAAWRDFEGEPQRLRLPSAPSRPLLHLDDPTAPQPRRHRELEGGMATILGRLQPCPVLGWRFVLLSHNTIRGAAGGSVLLAELCVARGLV